MRHLILNLEAPLMAFGGETIDNLGVIRPFPAVSMLTGLLANALGWRRIERERHQALQDQLVFAARIDREPAGNGRLTEYQTVQMADSIDLFVRNGRWVIGWTTRGAPDRRAGKLGSAGSGPFTHQRWRDYWADMNVTIALRLYPADGELNLEGLAEALDEPARPIFIGRKPCLPSERLFAGFSEGDTALSALLAWPLSDPSGDSEEVRTMWPMKEGVPGIEPSQTNMVTDERNWVSGLHGGGRTVCQAAIQPHHFSKTLPAIPGQSTR